MSAENEQQKLINAQDDFFKNYDAQNTSVNNMLQSNISTMPSLTGINMPQLGFKLNISGGTLPSGRSMGGLYSTFNPVVKMNKPNEAGSADESSGTAAATVKAKKKFTETKFGSGLKAAALSTPLGQGIKGISGLVKRIKAKKASKQTENKEE
jgi:hypothetical protein